VFPDQIDRFDSVFSLGDEVDVRKSFQQKGQLLASRLFVVNDERVDGHGDFARPSIGTGGAVGQLPGDRLAL